MNSLLGTIQLGNWQLGQVEVVAVTSGAFLAVASPDVNASGVGGQARIATGVLGTIRLGLFQLGQVPFGSVTTEETRGKGTFRALAFPDVSIATPRFSGSFSASAFPDVAAAGNFGPLLVAFKGFPDVAASGINYYADGAFTAKGAPDVFAQGLATGAIAFGFKPDVDLSPLLGQQVSCLVGPGVPVGVGTNYVY